MRKLALIFALACGLATGTAQAVIIAWTYTGVITESYDAHGNVLGDGAGSNLSVGSTLSVTFFLDLAKAPDCSLYSFNGQFHECNWGSTTEGWIESQATVFSGGTSFSVPDLIIGPGNLLNWDNVSKYSYSDPDLLTTIDIEESVFSGNIDDEFVHRELVDRNFATVVAWFDLFGDGDSNIPSLSDPLDVTGPFGVTELYIGRRQSGYTITDGNYSYLPEMDGYAWATVTSLTSQIIPTPGTLGILGLGLAGLAASRRRKH